VYSGPLPQAYFFAAPFVHDRAARAIDLEVDWSEVQANKAYRDFVRWIGEEITACYAATDSSTLAYHIVQALDKLDLPERADAYITHFVDSLYQERSP
jgi:hypothetical protein